MSSITPTTGRTARSCDRSGCLPDHDVWHEREGSGETAPVGTRSDPWGACGVGTPRTPPNGERTASCGDRPADGYAGHAAQDLVQAAGAAPGHDRHAVLAE